MSDAPQLVSPGIAWRDSYVEALREGLHLEPAREEDILLAARDFSAYLARRHDLSRPVILPDGQQVRRVPQTDLWLVRGARFLAVASIRLQLPPHLEQRGGNIGYAVRLSERRKGYGKLLLRLTLPHARALGLEKVLITCHDQNQGSIRIIEGAGGVLQDKVAIPGVDLPERRYWITL